MAREEPGGGLLAKGHPLGATGLAQIAELGGGIRFQLASTSRTKKPVIQVR
jgi:acetyl-CoA acetyltransferase